MALACFLVKERRGDRPGTFTSSISSHISSLIVQIRICLPDMCVAVCIIYFPTCPNPPPPPPSPSSLFFFLRPSLPPFPSLTLPLPPCACLYCPPSPATPCLPVLLLPMPFCTCLSPPLLPAFAVHDSSYDACLLLQTPPPVFSYFPACPSSPTYHHHYLPPACHPSTTMPVRHLLQFTLTIPQPPRLPSMPSPTSIPHPPAVLPTPYIYSPPALPPPPHPLLLLFPTQGRRRKMNILT